MKMFFFLKKKSKGVTRKFGEIVFSNNKRTNGTECPQNEMWKNEEICTYTGKLAR